jgi:hypothetical protein
MSKNVFLSMNVCPHCRKAKSENRKEFFNHIVKCETMDHSNSPITVTWHTKEEIFKPKIEKKDSIEISGSFRPVTR